MSNPQPLAGLLETCLYAADLTAAEQFYSRVLGLTVYSREADRHVFFRCGAGMFLVFNPAKTQAAPLKVGALAVPAHGAIGPGHLAFRVAAADLPAWREKLSQSGVPIEETIEWPQGGVSVYFRDPAGNSVELATPNIWGLA